MSPILSSIIFVPSAAQRVSRGVVWFQPRDIDGKLPVHAGLGRLIDRKRAHLGWAFVSPGSRTPVRLITREDVTIDRDYWVGALARALERRSPLVPFTNACRVVHAEADGFPGVVIDRYNDLVSFQITSAGAETQRECFIAAIDEVLAPAAIVEKNDIELRESEGLPRRQGLVRGETCATEVKDRDLIFPVDLGAGQKTGAYLDYRAFRWRLGEWATGLCLDAFCYEGWTAMHMARGASCVVAVDARPGTRERVEAVARRNGFANIKAHTADVFEFLEKDTRRYDLIHLDPPAFAKGARHRNAALRGYAKLLGLALPRLRPGGILMVSSCSHAVGAGLLEKVLMEALTRAGRVGKVIYRGIQDRDHPVLSGHPESLYLSAVAARVS